MADNRNFAALEWVVDEIGESLNEARQSLEAYVEDPNDTVRLRFCLTHIHQVHGSLQMVEFHGAAMLAEEMEQLTEAMLNDEVANAGEAQEVLMRALLQFPVYLNQVKTTRKDNPLVVLPLLNDLRAVRGESLLADTKLFTPSLAPARKATGERLSVAQKPDEFRAMVKKLRQMYQYSAAAFIRSVNTDDNLNYLKKVFQRLHKITQGSPRQPLWDICLALAEALEIDAIEPSVSVKNLLRQLDQQIKELAHDGPAALDRFTDEELIKNLLYYVARSAKRASDLEAGSNLRRIYDLYHLEEALLETPAEGDDSASLLSAPDAETIRSVAAALKVELDTVKQTLDEHLSGAGESKLDDTLPIIKRVSDTMAVLGFGDLRRRVIEQGELLGQALEGGGELSDEQLVSVAGNLMGIENDLDNLAESAGKTAPGQPRDEGDATLSRARDSVLRESRNGLEHAKDAIVEYIASQWKREHLDSVPNTLRDIRGGLDMLALTRPGRILGACARYIEEQLLEKAQTPEWTTLDTLADAITSVEYYLERLTGGDTEEETDMLLSVAEDSVSELGYAVAKFTRTSAAEDQQAPTDAESPLDVDAEEDTSAEDDADAEALAAAYREQAYDEAPQGEDAAAAEVEEDTARVEEDARETGEAAEDADEDIELEVPSVDEDPESEAPDSELPADSRESSETEDAEPAESASSSAAADEDDEDEIDEEIIEIFVEEAGEVTEAINNYFPRWAQDLSDQDSLVEFRRAFHTLKGSGRMVGAGDIGELAWSIENMLNRIIEETVQPHNGHIALIEKVRHLLPSMIEAYKNNRPNPEPELTARYEGWAYELADGKHPEELADDVPDFMSANQPAAQPEQTEEPAEPVVEEPADETLEEESEEDSASQLWSIFGVEALSHLKVVRDYIQRMEEVSPFYSPPSDNMQRALHTLKGSAHMAEITPVAELVTPLERFVKELRSYQVNINDDILQLLRDGVSYVDTALTDIKQGEVVEIPRLEQYVARVNELREIYVAPLVRQKEASADGQRPVDPQLLSIFMAEEMNLLLDADELIDKWRAQPEDVAQLKPMVDELRNLTHGAAHAHLPPMATLGEKLEAVYRRILDGKLTCSDDLCHQLNDAHMALLDMVDAIAAGQNLNDIPESVDRALSELLDLPETGYRVEADAEDDDEPEFTFDTGEGDELPAIEVDGESPDETTDEESTESQPAEEEPVDEEPAAEASTDEGPVAEEPSAEDPAEEETAEEAPVEDAPETQAPADAEPDEPEATEPEQPAEPLKPAASATPEEPDDDLDEQEAEVIEIFVEEAVELMEDIDRELNDWQEDWQNTDCVEELKRSLHTLKGGARLAGMTDIGDLSHEFESVVLELGGPEDLSEDLFKRLVNYQDQLADGVERARARLAGEEPPPAAPAPPLAEEPAATAPDEPAPEPAADQGNVVPFSKPAAPDPAKAAAAEAAAGIGPEQGGQARHLAVRRSGPQEVVKVSAELLEELVNLAGETSISRGRLEQQVSDITQAIDEMEATIQRLQEQLRRLDIETEAQIIFRQEQMAAHEDFDPLEMDRYSQLQQLSRSLVESASDLMDLKSTLSDKNRDTETLLLQQSRINTDLQEGLMRSRMVPFSRLVPRLRRIVRQAAAELDKDVYFELDNVEGELDRSVLERMVAPLEHMLRNAVDHGIESKDERRQAGKPETGNIRLSLAREGGDVLLRLIDDGRGINLERVREKALERGLMAQNANLSDQDVMQFILHAGFSTADKVTQISGRGVGMDVVHSEIKQLGGAMFIDSDFGHGTEFMVRLPFTVSVNRALMVQIGDDYYAIPLNSIEGIVRVSPYELEHYYQDEDARFEYAGENYLVRYLGTMLDSDAHPKLDTHALPLPVVLVRSADNTVAVQVDRLLGSREVVVKTLGVQFSAVRGVSGATVMGDGSVVVILDLHALIREQLAQGLAKATLLEPFQPVAAEEDEDEKTVMVVDDSVTVRKVTGRFLEREGYNVITAKDGAEALLMLQDRIPDVMLLDIEMPRVDGFEVAHNIRTSSRLQDIPIIMITSRTGQKHRDRAFNIGVNKYLGKPYQEEQLLKNIKELLGERQS